ncbi:unnamed protein product [Paramecium octaurelia]|uniref:Uncharacterized protein n=1 Tax=Paramecium octaurelia TaxID=43137 RepID=A0A8S1T4R5_PAROT|nr:unnamed protein product [Paramecium octaurelia]
MDPFYQKVGFCRLWSTYNPLSLTNNQDYLDQWIVMASISIMLEENYLEFWNCFNTIAFTFKIRLSKRFLLTIPLTVKIISLDQIKIHFNTRMNGIYMNFYTCHKQKLELIFEEMIKLCFINNQSCKLF